MHNSDWKTIRLEMRICFWRLKILKKMIIICRKDNQYQFDYNKHRFFRTSVAPNQFGHFHMNKCYNIEPQIHTMINGNNTQFEPQIQMKYQQSVSDTSTESTGCSITGQANIFSPQTNIIIPQTNTVRGGSICCGCQEHQCRCNTRSNSPQIIHYNPQSYYVHNQRQFQYSYGYLNPSQRIHNNMSIQNESKQRR
eukprot:11313_1